jgi:hypothetical protein
MFRAGNAIDAKAIKVTNVLGEKKISPQNIFDSVNKIVVIINK